jgi:uncharacterized membrane protein
MKKYLVAYVVLAAVFPVLDFAWFAGLARRFYQAEIGELLRTDLKLAPAVVFYGLYSAGVVVFVVAPALNHGDWRRTFALAAFFGLVAYGTYDLTNLATLKGFTLKAGLVDMAWGAAVTAVAASLSQLAAQRFG